MLLNAMSVADCTLRMFSELQRVVSIGDYIKFSDHSNLSGLGEIVEINRERIKLKTFRHLDSATMQSHSLSPLNPRDHPLASQDEMLEVYQTMHFTYISRHSILDVAFILPLHEAESGRFFLSCAENTYVIRFLHDGSRMRPWASSFYFSRHVIEPIGVRLFHSLNTLSDHIRRSMFHRPESVTTSHTFKLPLFPGESFWYLAYKLAEYSVHITVQRKQRGVKYYKSLKMESCVKQSTLTHLRILSKPGLSALQRVLGAGIGLGLAVNRPTKNRPVGYCSINSIFTSIDCGEIVPASVTSDPKSRCTADGIDFLFSEENRILSCHVRFKKITVTRAEDVTCRLPSAYVGTISSGVYLEALFYYENILYEVVEIDDDNSQVKSTSVQDNVMDLILPVAVVQQLVAAFGRS